MSVNFSNDNDSVQSKVTAKYSTNVENLGDYSIFSGELLRFPESNFYEEVNFTENQSFTYGSYCSNSSENCTFSQNGESYELQSNSNSSINVRSSKNQSVLVGKDMIDIRFAVNRSEIKRGKSYGFVTYNTRTGSPVTNTRVKFSQGEYQQDIRTSDLGKGMLDVKYGYPSDTINYTVVNTQDTSVDESLLEEASGEIDIYDYSQYRNERILNFSSLPDSVTIGEEFTSSVTRNVSEYDFVEVVATLGDREESVFVNENGEFRYRVPVELQQNYNLTLRAIDSRSNSYSSKTKQIKVKGDSDGDFVPDEEDECPEESGIVSLDGCPQKEVVTSLYRYYPTNESVGDEVDGFSLQPNQPYYLTLEDSEGETLNESLSLTLRDDEEGSTTTLNVNGSKEVFFEDFGGHTIIFDGTDEISSFQRRVVVEGPDKDFSVAQSAVLIVILLVLLAVAYLFFYEYSSLSKVINQMKNKWSVRDEKNS